MTTDDEPARELQGVILDLLVDGPSSFAGIFGGLTRHSGYAAISVIDAALTALQLMELRGLVEASLADPDQRGEYRAPTASEREAARDAYKEWLPEAQFGDLAVDEIGLWYKITDAGRLEWERSADSPGAPSGRG